MNKQHRQIWLHIVFICFNAITVLAQAPQQNINLDSLFLQARQLAFEQYRSEAKELCRQILEVNPNYHDASILYARTLAWDQQFSEAAGVLEGVLRKEPFHEDAILAMTDVLVWSGNPNKALEYLDRILIRQPTNTSMLFLRARILNDLQEHLLASVILSQILDLDPSHTNARELLSRIDAGQMRNHFSINYRGDYFDLSAPWHLIFAEYGRRTSGLGLLIARINIAERFDNQGMQFEIDAYPTIAQGTYLYLNAGYSPDQDVFPEFRAGVEVFQRLPRLWEASAGARFLNFPGNNLVILTGSISKYLRQYLFTFRPFYIVPNVGDHAQSYFITLRRFFTSPEHHLTLTAGTGFPADADALLGAELYDLTSNMFMLNYQQKISPHFLLRAGAGFQYYPDGVWGNKYTFEAGIAYRF
ncbi:MAG TPA: YaiO family outer membrane beta-barrel protein [Bacteroidales bacterium]|nr:YaiO family outer membrane beta-barrel protein [Bacteroidales bacterium]